LQSRREQAPNSATDVLLEHVRKLRHEAQQPIVALHEHLIARRFDRKLRKFIRKIGPQDDPRLDRQFNEVARAKLAEMVCPYLEAAGAEMNDPEALHAFRILGKRVRYAMEVFAGAFDAEFRQDLYPLVAMLQDRLGTINDHATAAALYTQWQVHADGQALREALQAGIDDERRALAEARQDFLAWWAAWRRDDLRRRFGRYVRLEAAGEGGRLVDEAGC
jgi:CHAD domain-containing protein